MLCVGIPLGLIGVVLMLSGPELWGMQLAVILVAVTALLICGRERRKNQ
jgi:hypothetical protein